MGIVVNSPGVGEVWNEGETHQVKWTSDAGATSYRVSAVPADVAVVASDGVATGPFSANVQLPFAFKIRVDAVGGAGGGTSAESPPFVLRQRIGHVVDTPVIYLNGAVDPNNPPQTEHQVDDNPNSPAPFQLTTIAVPAGATPIAAWATPYHNVAAVTSFAMIQAYVEAGRIMVQAGGYGAGAQARLRIQVHVLYAM